MGKEGTNKSIVYLLNNLSTVYHYTKYLSSIERIIARWVMV